MELWVRSQNKRSLLKAESVICSNSGYVLVNNITFGSYENEQRCLEILDEIQQAISTAPILIKNMGELGKEDIEKALSLSENVRTVYYNDDVYPIKTLVYQMPEK